MLYDSTIPLRFWRKVYAHPSGCWLWVGAKGQRGYGRFCDEAGRMVQSHRWMYERLIGPIPDGLTCDHLCRNRACVNPTHIQLVPLTENILRGSSFSAVNARKTHCVNGHEYDLINTYFDPRGRRYCRACWRGEWRRKPSKEASSG